VVPQGVSLADRECRLNPPRQVKVTTVQIIPEQKMQDSVQGDTLSLVIFHDKWHGFFHAICHPRHLPLGAAVIRVTNTAEEKMTFSDEDYTSRLPLFPGRL
jgi:hypothetical protein